MLKKINKYLSFIILCIILTCATFSLGCAEKNNKKEIKIYINNKYVQSIYTEYTDSASVYKTAESIKPSDINTDPNDDYYFYGWFIDKNFQTPLTNDTPCTEISNLYGKWIYVYKNWFSYSVDYGIATITKCSSSTTLFVIPAYINSFPVKFISDNAFNYKTTIKTAFICNGIEYIDGFGACNSMTNIIIPNSVKKFGNQCFMECALLKSINIPDSVTYIGDHCFKKCISLKSITIPDSVTTISEYAFFDCISLTNVTIGNGVTTIGECTFYGCSSLTSIECAIPEGVTSIGLEAFYGCSSLTSIAIPEGVTSIGWGAFFGCSSLTSIAIPEGVTKIGEYTFYGCSSLTNVTIPKNIKTIGVDAFSGCKNLTKIVFSGTKKQWNAINKKDNWDTNTGNYSIQCTDGIINKQK